MVEQALKEHNCEETKSGLLPENQQIDNEIKTESTSEQTQITSSFFENEIGKKYLYTLKYDDIMKGLTLLANSKKTKIVKIQNIIIYICGLVSLIIAVSTKNMLSIGAVCLCLTYAYYKSMKPINYRRRVARIIDARNDEYTAILYDDRIKIIENGNEKEFLYNTLSYLDHMDIMLVTRDGLVMILPKRYFGNDVKIIKQTFKNSFKSYKE